MGKFDGASFCAPHEVFLRNSWCISQERYIVVLIIKETLILVNYIMYS